MLKFCCVLLVIVGCVLAVPWPSKINVDARGVHWTYENGTSHFFESEDALTATGMIPFMRYVECERGFMFLCSRMRTYCSNGKCRENVEMPSVCMKLKCAPVPSSNMVQIEHAEIPASSFGEELGLLAATGGAYGNGALDFDPKSIRVHMKAADSLSVLWHIR